MPGLTNADLAKALTPLERSVLILAGPCARDPERIAEELKHRQVFWGEDGSMHIKGGNGRSRAEEVRVILAALPRKIALLRRAQAAREPTPSPPRPRSVPRTTRPGKPVTLTRTLPTPTKEVAEVSDSPSTPVPETGFVQEIHQRTQVEVEEVLRDLARLRFRADQVRRVLEALGLPVPDEITFLTAESVLRVSRPEPTPSPVEPAAAPPVPEPAPDPSSSGDAADGPAADAPPPPAETPKPPEGETAGRRPPSHPGIEAVPEELRYLPAAQKGGPLTQRISAARDQDAIYRIAQERQTFVALEIQAALTEEMPKDRISKHLKEMAEAGLFEATGVNRFPAGHDGGGKASKEYRPLVRQTDAPGPVSAEPVSPEALAKVRDFVCRQQEPFAPRAIVEQIGLAEEVVRAALQKLIERSVVEYVGMDDLELYEYRKPSDPGAAAMRDAARHKEETKREAEAGRGSAGGVVTNGRIRVSHKETQAIIDKVYAAGGHVQRTGGGHIYLSNPEHPGERVLIGSTESSTSKEKTLKRLRDIGLQV